MNGAYPPFRTNAAPSPAPGGRDRGVKYGGPGIDDGESRRETKLLHYVSLFGWNGRFCIKSRYPRVSEKSMATHCTKQCKVLNALRRTNRCQKRGHGKGGRCPMKWERITIPTRLHGVRRSPPAWVIVGVLTIGASFTACTMVYEATGSASGGIPALERITRDNVVATLSTDRRRHAYLLMLPIGQNMGVLQESWKSRRTFSLIHPGKARRRFWSGEASKARLSCAADNSGFIFTQYDKALRPWYRDDRKIIAAKVFNASGKEIAAYLPERKCHLRAALSGGRSRWVEPTGGRGSNFLLYDATGNLLSEAGPFKAKESAWSNDGNKLLVNVAEKTPGGGHIGSPWGESIKILIVDMAEGKVLYELPPAYRGQVSPHGRFVVTAGKGRLRFWKEGKEIKVFGLKTPATMAVFSPDGRYVAFGIGRGIHMYRTDDWTRAMAVEPPEEGQTFGIGNASLSNTGRLIVSSYTTEQREHNRSNLICLYDSDGTRLWLGRYPWKNGRPTYPGISKLTPDGHEAYIRVGDKLVRVIITEK